MPAVRRSGPSIVVISWPPGIADRGDAGPHGLAVQVHRAGAAGADAAAEFRAGEANRSRNAQSNGIAGSASTACWTPLILICGKGNLQ